MHDPRRRRLLVAVAFLAFVSLGLPDGVLGVAWPSVRQTFGLPLSQLGVLLTATVLGYLVSSSASGEVVRRVGVGGLLLASSLVVVASLAGFALAPAWPVMALCGLLAGLGAGAIDAGINAYAAAHFPPRWVTWLHACYGVGATLGPLTMTSVLAAGLSWRLGYAAIGAAVAVLSLLFAATVRLWEAPARAAGAGEAVVPATAAEALRRPAVWGNAALFFLYTGAEVTAGQWAYSLFTESRHVAPSVAGGWTGAYWASLTFGRIVSGAAAGRLGKAVILRIAMAAAPLAAGLVWWDPGGAGLLGLALLGFALAPVFPMLISDTPERVGPSFAAQAVGFQIAAANLGAAAVPGLAGVLARRYGLEVVGPYLVAATVGIRLLYGVSVRTGVRSRAGPQTEPAV